MSSQPVAVIKVHEILMVTMPPDPDDATISNLQAPVLAAMEEHDAKGVALDISAVDTFDSFFARTVVETAQMVALMGGRTVIAGMRPAVAITAVQLGLTLTGVATALSVNRALDLLQRAPQRSRPR